MVLAQLAKILTNPSFTASPTLSRLLSFLVDQTLAGKGHGLKEYTLAVKVFERPESFDPRLDPVVRVQASKLRSKLNVYYSGPGASDPLRIELPRGVYVPQFTLITPIRQPESDSFDKPSERLPVVTVLPCADLSPGRDQESLCDGIAEEITDALASVPSVRVTARTSAFCFKGRREDVREIGARLGATVVLESSLRRDGSRLRITARLTQVKSGISLWSRTLNANFSDVFAVQEEIARSIAGALRIEFTDSDYQRLTRNRHRTGQTHEQYLLGRFYLNSHDPDRIRHGMSLFREVIALDPVNAQAHGALARSWTLLALRGNAPVHEAMPKALKLAAKAQSLDSTLPDASAVLGIVESLYQWKWTAAEKSFRHAIQLNPSHAEARSGYAFCVLLPTGRTDLAIEHLREAVKIDPVGLNPRLALALAFYARGDSTAAIQQCKLVLELAPACSEACAIYGLALALGGDFSGAARMAEHILQITADGPIGMSIGAAGCLFALAGSKQRADECLDKLLNAGGGRHNYWMALVKITLGRKTEAIRLLASALRNRELWAPSIAYEPLANPLRSNARFNGLVRELGLDKR